VRKSKEREGKGTEKRHGKRDHPVRWLFPYFSLQIPTLEGWNAGK
jgi:hypothetical protein